MTTYPNSTHSRSELGRPALGHLLLAVVVLAAILFLTAGTIRYWEAWLYMAVVSLPPLGLFVYMINRAPDLLERRMRYMVGGLMTSRINQRPKMGQATIAAIIFWVALWAAMVTQCEPIIPRGGMR